MGYPDGSAPYIEWYVGLLAGLAVWPALYAALRAIEAIRRWHARRAWRRKHRS